MATALWPAVGVLAVPIATVASSIVETIILSGVLLNWLRTPADWRVTAHADEESTLADGGEGNSRPAMAGE